MLTQIPSAPIFSTPQWLEAFLCSPVGLLSIFVLMVPFSLFLSGLSQRLPARCGVDFTDLAQIDDGRFIGARPFFYDGSFTRIKPIPVLGWIVGRKDVFFAHLLTEAALCIGAPLVAWLSHGSSVLLALYILVCIISLFDFIAHWIPDFLTMSVTFLGLLSTPHLVDAVISYAAAWYAAFFGLSAVRLVVRGQTMNYGDVWCFAAFSPFIMVRDLPVFAISATALALVQAVIFSFFIQKRDNEPVAIPFGPAISCAGFAAAAIAHWGFLTQISLFGG